MDGSTMVRIKVAAGLAAVSVNPVTLRHTGREINIAAAMIGVQLTGDVLQQVRTAFGYLAAAASGPDGSQAAELRQARAAATRLITDPDHYAGSSLLGMPSAAEVRALGYLANYYHSLISRLPRQALVDGYQCTEQFLALGVQMLPAEYFSRDYRRLISGSAVQRALLSQRLGEAAGNGAATRWRRPGEYRPQAGYCCSACSARPRGTSWISRTVASGPGRSWLTVTTACCPRAGKPRPDPRCCRWSSRP